jgi:hypothetical protein
VSSFDFVWYFADQDDAVVPEETRPVAAKDGSKTLPTSEPLQDASVVLRLVSENSCVFVSQGLQRQGSVLLFDPPRDVCLGNIGNVSRVFLMEEC